MEQFIQQKRMQKYDKGRTYELQELKVTVIRFWNDEVINDIETVLAKIKEIAK